MLSLPLRMQLLALALALAVIASSAAVQGQLGPHLGASPVEWATMNNTNAAPGSASAANRSFIIDAVPDGETCFHLCKVRSSRAFRDTY